MDVTIVYGVTIRSESCTLISNPWCAVMLRVFTGRYDLWRNGRTNDQFYSFKSFNT